MTATIDHVDTQTDTQTETAQAHDGTAGVEGALLLAVLQERIADLAFTEPDEVGSHLSAGRELLEMAATARRAAAYLGGHAGTAVTQAAGVVVVRELVAATRALADAVALTSRP